MPARHVSVKKTCLQRNSESEVQRTARADEGSCELEICACALEQRRIFVTESERSELVEAPVRDTAILELELFERGMLLG